MLNVYPPGTAQDRPLIDIPRLVKLLSRYWLEVVLLALIAHLLVSRGARIQISIVDLLPSTEQSSLLTPPAPLVAGGVLPSVAMNVSLPAGGVIAKKAATSASKTHAHVAASAAEPDFNDVAATDDPAPHISNLTLILSPDYGKRKGLSEFIINAKKQRVQRYLDRYAPIARREMHQYGIPASITLAQGLLESNAGDSKLAVESSNHFGIKCRSKCRGCTCRNYGDDTVYDMFRVFTRPADSFREHSILLTSARYKHLKAKGNDYAAWAHGLKKAGYATDKRYGYKLIKIIKELDLHEYDLEAGV